MTKTSRNSESLENSPESKPLENVKIALVIAAAGSSTRMGGQTKKEYLPLEDGTVLSKSAKVFLEALNLSSLTITVKKGGEKDAENALFSDKSVREKIKSGAVYVEFVEGGKTRQESIFNALKSIAEKSQKTEKQSGKTNPKSKTKLANQENQNNQNVRAKPDIVLIHDGARPFVSPEIVLETAKAAFEFGAAAPGITPTDTQKIIDKDGFIKTHLERSSMTAIQTPQGFRFEKLFSAHKKAISENREFTDDTEIYALFEGKVKVVQGDAKNKKITYSQDYQRTDFFKTDPQKNVKKSGKEKKMEIRCGFGYDLHRLEEGRKLMLGGIEIPFEKGEAAHSDGDVLLHAITDSLLGASGLGDIGTYFPPEDEKWKDADSKILLKKCWDDVKNAGWKLSNLDCVIKLEKPKFVPHRKKVIESIAEILEVPEDKIFVKAKTSEKLEAVGEGKAVEAFANCLLTK